MQMMLKLARSRGITVQTLTQSQFPEAFKEVSRSMTGKPDQIDGFLLVLYILAFVLLREWLLPVMELSDTDHLTLFLFFIVLAFIFSLARLKWWISGPVKIIYIFGVLHYIYFDKVLFSKETVSELLHDVFSNFSIIVNGDWENLTNPFRTILFFILLWMTTYLDSALD